MDYNEIIKALVLIRDICASSECDKCVFVSVKGDCCITGDDPDYWQITDIDGWRAFY